MGPTCSTGLVFVEHVQIWTLSNTGHLTGDKLPLPPKLAIERFRGHFIRDDAAAMD